MLIISTLSCSREPINNPDSLLVYAVKKGDINLLKIAIAKNGDLNYRDEKGRTPLHWSAFYGDVETAKVLISHGADISIKDDNGLTPLDIAKINNRKKFLSEINKFLKEVKDDKSSSYRH